MPGTLKDIKIGVDARRTQITDYNNLYASATAAPTTFIANGEHRLQGMFGQGTYSLHRRSRSTSRSACAATSTRR